jgi:hypothetical protein
MSKSDFNAITEVVPQISYDIIGRIIPGIIVIVSLMIAVVGPTQTFEHLDKLIIHPDPPLSGWAVVLLIIAAYILAVVLDGIGHIPAYLLCQRDKDKLDHEASLGSLKLDAVGFKSPQVGARHTKLSAEINQAQALVVGWFISATINLYFLIAAFSLKRLWLEVILIIGIVGAFLFRKGIQRSRKFSLSNHWLLLQCDELFTSRKRTTTASASSVVQQSNGLTEEEVGIAEGQS